ncbi:hypothetical protein ASPCAL14638 [Aspergillus calidoustus]|uniref:AB hydrolase-1 domain-containing protein n=1 Tax=Aspergillus calidoustus TaxID=454130 RepID=A0A0U5GGM5_ASPCI|nr:hypothetical protein ASPCAL14638 [Aspergillus calidoustus]
MTFLLHHVDHWVKNLKLPGSKANIFYREAGSDTAPVMLLLHGFPSSSHQYRNLIPILAPKYHGFSYTSNALAGVILEFLEILSIKKYSVFIFDYGSPVGLRLALKNPDAVQSQIRELWTSNNDPAVRSKLAASLLSLEATKWQYEEGTTGLVAPESYALDYALLQRPGQTEIQLDLFLDYQTNLKLYPQFHEYFRTSQVPLLAAWGRHDQIFIPAGAEAFKQDLPKAEVHLLDAGHFAVETDTAEIGALILDFLARNGI